MDINRFTAALTSRLESAGADRKDAAACARVFVSSMSEDEALKISALVDNEDVMNKITASLMSRIKASASSRPAPVPVDADDDDDDYIDEMLEESDPYRDAGRHAQPQPPRQEARPAPTPQQRPTQPQQARPAQPQPQGAPQARPMQPHGAQGRPAQPQPQGAPGRPTQMQPQGAPSRPVQPGRPAQPQQRRQTPASQQRAAAKHREEKKPPERRPIYKPDPNADYQKFYLILACSSPLWGLALLFGAAAFVFAVGALSVSIVLLIIGLFVGVAVGTVVALVGIIYGITQLFEYAPIGTYEIGLGIMIGGAVMFFGVLAYNVAVRLLPYVIKQVMVLLSFTIHKCVELYYYAKGRCADL